MKRLLLLATIFLASWIQARELPDPATLRDPIVVDAFRSLPVLEGGRVKPLDTHARFLLLRIHGKQSIKVHAPDNVDAEHPDLPGVKKLDATEFLLLSWFRPDIARKLPLFVVDNSQAVGEIDVEPKEMRDRYSWNEINPAREKLREKATAYSELDSKKRTSVQRNLIDLARNFFDYDATSDYLESSRTDWRAATREALPESVKTSLPAEGDWTLWQVAESLGRFIKENGADALPPGAGNALLTLMIDKAVRPGMTIAIVPPADPEVADWLKMGDVVTNVMRDDAVPEQELAIAKQRDGLMAAAAEGVEPLRKVSSAWVGAIREAAEARGELTHVDREVNYYKKDFFTRALVYFLLGGLVAILSLVAPQSKFARILGKLALVSLVVALAYNVWGITERCIINSRPPVATLYETIIFITAVAAVLCLLLEWVLKNNVALALTGFLGATGMFLAMRFMALDGQDTMPTLEAVLITNFWLATHVTLINIGYAGCLLAAIISMVQIGYRTLARGPKAEANRKMLTRVVYGVVCFGLLASLVGTVLGGIWANDSWGRFWGWDPKENGALMIVIMGLIILHARLGGYIRETGLHVLSVMMGAVTVFSWFGVNQLSVGLHSYGFTEGVGLALRIAYSIHGVFMLLGLSFWVVEKFSAKAAKQRAVPGATVA